MQSIVQNKDILNISSQLDRLGFIKISDFPPDKFYPYQKHTNISDLAYSLLYAWELDFMYRIKIVCQNPVIAGFDMSGQLFFSVIPVSENSLIQTVNTVSDMFSELGTDFCLKYVSDNCKDLFAQNGINLTYNLDFSDYIYTSAEFINTDGKKNSSKRHEYNSIPKNYPIHRYESISAKNQDDFVKIFCAWCDGYSCDECICGCEKRAFLRLFELVKQYPDNYYGGIVYLDNVPMSFGIAEKINENYVCYHVQKNAVPISGLTYYLHYNMALEHTDVPYINWGEDMGIAGLRFNKQKYHPSRMENKYEAAFGTDSNN